MPSRAGERDELAQQTLRDAARRARPEPDPHELGVAELLRDRERVGDRLLRRLVEAGMKRRLVEVAAAVGDGPREHGPHPVSEITPRQR